MSVWLVWNLLVKCTEFWSWSNHTLSQMVPLNPLSEFVSFFFPGWNLRQVPQLFKSLSVTTKISCQIWKWADQWNKDNFLTSFKWKLSPCNSGLIQTWNCLVAEHGMNILPFSPNSSSLILHQPGSNQVGGAVFGETAHSLGADTVWYTIGSL